MTAKEAVKHAEKIVEYCNSQRGCQNCIFRLYGSEHWKCHIQAFDLQDILLNIEAKRKNGGYI